MSSSQPSPEVTELTGLKTGLTYKLEADGAQLYLQVVSAGNAPVCLATGVIDGEKTEDDTSPVLIQLIGWTFYGDDFLVQGSLQMFQSNTKPAGVNFLQGVWIKGTTAQVVSLGCDAVITEAS